MKLHVHEKNESGFTMIEIIVVAIIIAVLALIAIPTYLNQRKAAWNATVQSDVSNAAIRLNQTKDFSGALPSNIKRSQGVVLQVTAGQYLLVGKGTDNACVEGWYDKSPTDTRWSFNIKERKLKSGSCQLG